MSISSTIPAEQPASHAIAQGGGRRRPRPDPETVRDILVVLRNNQVGDMLCSQPLYDALKAGYPGASITVLAAPTNYPVPFRVLNPHIDHVEHYDRSLWRSILHAARLRRRRRFQIGIVPSTVKLSFSLHLLNWVTGARTRVGVRSIDGMKNPARFLLNISGDFRWDESGRHQRERNRDIAQLLGCDLPDGEMDRSTIDVRLSSRARADETLRERGISDETLLIGIHPGAGDPARMWPVAHFAELCARLTRLYPARVVMMPGPVDGHLLSVTQAAFDAVQTGLEILPAGDIDSLGAFLHRLRLFISNDTGAMHVAAAVGVPSVYMTFSRHVPVWAPRLMHVRALCTDTSDLASITVDEAYESCVQMLGSPAAVGATL